MSPTAGAAVEVRDLAASDLERVVAIDAGHTGERKPAYWRRMLGDVLSGGEPARVGLVATVEGDVAGYLLGEVRAFEFGSEACGWVLAIGVDPGHQHQGIASRLLGEAGRRFLAAGVGRMRTMVRLDQVPVQALFRASGFVGGPYVQLELDLSEEEEG
jgi:ribosomal protein S18 acetylase RimI-like enzyme